jgi:hypothetical protein
LFKPLIGLEIVLSKRETCLPEMKAGHNDRKEDKHHVPPGINTTSGGVDHALGNEPAAEPDSRGRDQK